MGDDTWLTVFSTAFHPEMSHDFDSFNVEDPHTVDNGVIANLFPLLTNSTHAHSWDLLIGHFLGVDHVDHRVGPDHLTMQAKQQQMNDVLKRVVGLLDNRVVQSRQLFATYIPTYSSLIHVLLPKWQ
jgi:GPI ethanolamine phosphate transferase 3 subunit O